MKTSWIKYLSITLCSCASLSAAPSPQLLNKIFVDMPKAEAISILGNPTATSVLLEAESVVCLDYDFLKPEHSYASDYHVILQDNKVRFYGEHSCKQAMSNSDYQRVFKK